MLASDLFAAVNSTYNRGPLECHWCGAKCDRRWTHDDPGPVPYQKTILNAKKPGNPYICVGCWIYRKQSTTLTYLGGSLKDRQSLRNHSWIITDKVLILDKDYSQDIYKLLLAPPKRFSLSIISSVKENYLHHAVVNNFSEVLADTEFTFTYDNSPYQYSVYELFEGLKNGVEGKLPGVRVLVDYLGKYEFSPEEIKEPQKGAGRPTKANDTMRNNTKKIIR